MPAFAHIALSCRDPLETERFYSTHFDFRRARVIPLGDGNQIVFLKNAGGVYLELFKAEGERPDAQTADGPHYPCIRHIAFLVVDVDAMLEKLGDGVQVTLGPLDFDAFIPGWRTAWVADPDGNIVEITQGYQDEDNPPPLE
jgi:glyoxylase I family protein